MFLSIQSNITTLQLQLESYDNPNENVYYISTSESEDRHIQSTSGCPRLSLERVTKEGNNEVTLTAKLASVSPKKYKTGHINTLN